MSIDPITLSVIAIGASVASGVAGMAASAQATSAQMQSDMNNAAVAERNKKFADQDRQLAVQTAQLATEDKDRENRRNLAALRAAYGASGLEMAGSPLDVLADTSIEMALDSRRTEYEGQVRNREGVVQMLSLEEEAANSRRSAKNAGKAGQIATVGSFFSMGAKAAGQAYTYQTGRAI